MWGRARHPTIPGQATLGPHVPPTPTLLCPEHPGLPAAWWCPACARSLCPECAELLEVAGGVEVVGCLTCGGSAPPLRIPGPEESFPASLRGLLRMPVTALGFAGLWLLAAAGGTGVRPAGPWALLSWSAPMWVVCIGLLRATAERGATFGASVRVSLTSELLVPAARGWLLTAPLLLRADALGPEVGAALALLGGVCAPFVLTRLAAGTRLLRTLDVRWLLRAWAASGRDGVLAGLASAGVMLFSRLLWGTAASGAGGGADALGGGGRHPRGILPVSPAAAGGAPGEGARGGTWIRAAGRGRAARLARCGPEAPPGRSAGRDEDAAGPSASAHRARPGDRDAACPRAPGGRARARTVRIAPVRQACWGPGALKRTIRPSAA